MATLPRSLEYSGSDHFSRVLSEEIRSLGPGVLPLHRAGNRGGAVDEGTIMISVLGKEEKDDAIEAHIGVFFAEIAAGGSCSDHGISENAYCEMRVSIDRHTAAVEFQLLAE